MCARSSPGRLVNLAGKDYFTVAEAAEYAGISVSHWRARIQREFPPGEFYGKLIYRKVDVQRFIESKVKWPQPMPTERRGSMIGRVIDPSVEARLRGSAAARVPKA
jgi:hypothetical protein